VAVGVVAEADTVYAEDADEFGTAPGFPELAVDEPLGEAFVGGCSANGGVFPKFIRIPRTMLTKGVEECL